MMGYAGICEAIRGKQIVSFVYTGKLRTVEPHMLGYNAKGELTLSAWQLSGGSAQDWRYFLVSNISGFATTGKNFQFVRPDYNPRDRNFPRMICRA